MQVQAPKGQFRVIGQEAVELADRSGELYLWTYVYDDNGELLYEAGSYREHGERLKKEPPEGHKI